MLSNLPAVHRPAMRINFRLFTATRGFVMFIHVATLYSIQSAATDTFIPSIRAGGDWQQLARRIAPDLVTSDLLQHQYSLSPVFLCIDFWVSREKYLSARESPAYEPLFQIRSEMANATFELGVFAFPLPSESEERCFQAEDACAGTIIREIQ
jgi:hypothetical protein